MAPGTAFQDSILHELMFMLPNKILKHLKQFNPVVLNRRFDVPHPLPHPSIRKASRLVNLDRPKTSLRGWDLHFAVTSCSVPIGRNAWSRFPVTRTVV
jgi:hypothetical protein